MNSFFRRDRTTRGSNCKYCAYHSQNPDYKGIHIKGCEAPAPVHKVCNFSYEGFWPKRFEPRFRKGDKVRFITPEFDHFNKIFEVLEDSRPCGEHEEVFCKALEGGAWDTDNFSRVF